MFAPLPADEIKKTTKSTRILLHKMGQMEPANVTRTRDPAVLANHLHISNAQFYCFISFPFSQLTPPDLAEGACSKMPLVKHTSSDCIQEMCLLCGSLGIPCGTHTSRDDLTLVGF